MESGTAAPVPVQKPEYWAFISYSHEDLAWAKRVQRSLEALRIPETAASETLALGPRSTRLRPVFRDVDELAASSDLGEDIRRALDAAATLIVVCSPQSARSRWVDAEIRHFIARGRADRILLLLVAGEPRVERPGSTDLAAAFPPAVADLPGEPLWVDARTGAESRRRATLRLAAGILDVGFDGLWRRHQRRRRRQTAAFGGAATVVAVALGGLLAVQSRPVDLADCPLSDIVFRDPWIGDEFTVLEVGVNLFFLCGDDGIQQVRPTEPDCTGPYGVVVLKGLHETTIQGDAPTRQTVYFVYNIIKGSPCCWWDAFDEADVRQITGADGFRWLPGSEQPGLDFGFATIDLEEPFSQESESLELLSNPLIAAVCRQSRVEATLNRISRRLRAGDE